MFDKLIDLLAQWIGYLQFWVVVDCWKLAVVVRFGKFQRELQPGIHWKIPFGVDRIIGDNIVPRTIKLKAQALTTKDGKSVVVSAVVTSTIHNIRKALLEVETVDNVLEDSCYGAIGAAVAASDWSEIATEEFADTLAKTCRKGAFKYGVEIQRVQFSDLALARAMRLYTEDSKPPVQ